MVHFWFCLKDGSRTLKLIFFKMQAISILAIRNNRESKQSQCTYLVFSEQISRYFWVSIDVKTYLALLSGAKGDRNLVTNICSSHETKTIYNHNYLTSYVRAI